MTDEVEWCNCATEGEGEQQASCLANPRALGPALDLVECGRATQVPWRRKGEPGISLAASDRFCGDEAWVETLSSMLLHANETCVSHLSAHSYSA